MPENPVITSPTIVPWPEGTGAVAIGYAVEYAPDALETLRRAALDGLIALPRIGMGIGGLLFGTRKTSGGRAAICILDSVSIPCSHAQGPSFTLSPEETRHAVELTGRPGPLTVVGWYCSGTRGQKKLNPETEQLFGVLCPEPWQIMLVLRPSMAEPSRAELVFRDRGQTIPGPVVELHPLEAAQPDAAQPELARPNELITPEATTPPSEPALLASAPSLVRQPFATPALSSRFVQPSPPLFATQPPPRSQPWLPWALAATLFGTAGGAAAWLTREDWLPRPPLQLEVADKQGQVTFHWNTDAVRGQKGAVFLVNDGGDLLTFPLGREKLGTGALLYVRKSARVTGTLRIGDHRAIATFLEPVTPPKPAAP